MALWPRKRVGVIGLGIIGSRVAASLRAGGHHVFVWNRTPKPVPNFLGSPAEVAKVCPVLQLFVADGEALTGVIESIASELTKNHIVLAHATVGPETALEAARLVEKSGAAYLDAPFTGSRLAAESRQLVYYVAGKSEALEKARGVLMSSAKMILRMGDVGQASAVKIATNMVTAATVEALAEAIAVVQSAGIDPKFLMEAMANNANYSPAVALKLPKMVAEDFEPHFSLKNMFKDLHLALRMADVAKVRIPATETVADRLFEGLKQGWGDLDFSATVKHYLPEHPPEEPLPSDLQPEHGDHIKEIPVSELTAALLPPVEADPAPAPPLVAQPKPEETSIPSLPPPPPKQEPVSESKEESTPTVPQLVQTPAAAPVPVPEVPAAPAAQVLTPEPEKKESPPEEKLPEPTSEATEAANAAESETAKSEDSKPVEPEPTPAKKRSAVGRLQGLLRRKPKVPNP